MSETPGKSKQTGKLSRGVVLGTWGGVIGVGVGCSAWLMAMAGIPITSGFMGKFAVFSAAVSQGWAWLAVVGVLASAVTAYIYFKLIVTMYLGDQVSSTTVVAPSWMTSFAILLGVAVTLFLGVMPAPVLELAQSAAAFVR